MSVIAQNKKVKKIETVHTCKQQKLSSKNYHPQQQNTTKIINETETFIIFFLSLHQKLCPWRCRTTCNQRRPYFLFFWAVGFRNSRPGVTAMRPFHWSRASGTAALIGSEPF